MRPRRRGASSGSRSRTVPARSRVTVRRGPPAPRLATLAAALRQSRDALGTLQSELDALLAALRNPRAAVDPAAAQRLRDAARAAGLAFDGLSR
jgi:hypothetical protein